MIDISSIGLGELISTIGGLGLAASGLVDSLKSGSEGGLSNVGFAHIEKAWGEIVPHASTSSSAIGKAARKTLHGNWINGMALPDQRAVAKSLVKLSLDANSAPHFAQLSGVSSQDLADVADLMSKGKSLSDPGDPEKSARMATAFGRFEFVITALLDGAYQRADQQYRNRTKVVAALVAVVLAVVGGLLLQYSSGAVSFIDTALSFLCGLIAVPLAPIAKDLASALTAGVKVAQALRR
jgi:hypothetical protein